MLPSSAFSVSLANIDVVAKRAIVIPTRVLQLKIFIGVIVKQNAEQAERERKVRFDAAVDFSVRQGER